MTSHTENENINGNKSNKGGAGGKNIPGSLPECEAYFSEIKSTPKEAAAFYDYFTSNGWKVGGKAVMKDWKAAARNWVRRKNETSKPHRNEPAPVIYRKVEPDVRPQ